MIVEENVCQYNFTMDYMAITMAFVFLQFWSILHKRV